MNGTVRSSSTALSTFIYARTRIFEGNLYRVAKVPCEGDQISHYSTSSSEAIHAKQVIESGSDKLHTYTCMHNIMYNKGLTGGGHHYEGGGGMGLLIERVYMKIDAGDSDHGATLDAPPHPENAM